MPPSVGPQATCSECGEKFFLHKKGDHVCLAANVERNLLARFEKDMKDGKGPYLTPRMKKQVEFYRWLEANGRL